MNEKAKNILLGLLVVGLVSMTIAYAALSTNLKIGNNDTSATVKGGSWNIFFEGGEALTPVGDRVSWVGSPTLTSTQIKGIKATFGSTANGEIKYNFRIKNIGSINAKIIEPITINKTCKINGTTVSSENDTAICDGITATIKYRDYVKGITSGEYNAAGDGVTMALNDLLPSQSYVEAQLTITAIDNVVNRLPSGDMTVEFEDIDIVYGQTNETPNALVSGWNPTFGSGTTFTPSYYKYEKSNSLTITSSDVTEPTKNVFAGLDASGNKGVCIKKDGKVHCFQFNNYEYENQHLQNVFSSTGCDSFSDIVECDEGQSGFYCYTTGNGNVRCQDQTDSSYCFIYYGGVIQCN